MHTMLSENFRNVVPAHPGCFDVPKTMDLRSEVRRRLGLDILTLFGHEDNFADNAEKIPILRYHQTKPEQTQVTFTIRVHRLHRHEERDTKYQI